MRFVANPSFQMVKHDQSHAFVLNSCYSYVCLDFYSPIDEKSACSVVVMQRYAHLWVLNET